MAVLAGCGGGGDSSSQEPSTTAHGAFGLELVGRYSEPVELVERPGDGLYVVERKGRIVPAAGGAPLLDIRKRVTTEGEGAMLSAAFPPGHRDRVYVAYAGRDKHLHVDGYGVGPDGRADVSTRRSVLAIAHPNFVHWGGLLAYGPDGSLYLSTGDGGPAYPIPDTAQDPTSLLGKLLRLDPSTGEAEVVALGLRNPWRYSFDRKTGDLWIGDVGDFTEEEIDHVPFDEAGGANFGWPELEGDAQTTSDLKAPPPLVPPAHTYERTGKDDDPYCAVTGGYVVRDRALPELRGRYLYGDFCDGSLVAARVERSGELGAERELGLEVRSLASFGEDRAGRLYAISLEGPVYRIAGR